MNHVLSETLSPCGMTRCSGVQTILRYASPEESLSVWGWLCDLNVQTGMGRATSDNYFDYLIVYNGVVPDYFKKLYVADIRRSNPPSSWTRFLPRITCSSIEIATDSKPFLR